MTQEYTPVSWQDETTSQQGTLINAERLNQMQTAHHFADGLEEVDAIPTADPGVDYHKIVYCTADSTLYRWDGTEWTADIDDETKRLLEEEIARATQAESQLNQRVDDEHDARVDAEAAINDRITDEATELAQRITTEASTRYTADTALGTRITNETSARETADTNLGNRITAEATARAEADTALGGRIDTEQARAEAAEQANAQAIANTYTKAETDTLLAGKASTSAVQTLDTRVGALETGLADTYSKSQTDTLLAGKADDSAVVHKAGAETIPGAKTFTNTLAIQSGAPYLQMKSTSAMGTNQYLGFIQELDANGAEIFDIYPTTDAQGRVSLNIAVNGNGPIKIPSPGAGAPSNSAATIATLDGYLPMVRTTDYQVITGAKIFDGTPGACNARSNNIDPDNPPANETIVGEWQALGLNNAIMGQIIVVITPSGSTYMNAILRNADGTYKAVRLATSD